jgi:dihydrofolate synthase / folylpolyglutamate synthase
MEWSMNRVITLYSGGGKSKMPSVMITGVESSDQSYQEALDYLFSFVDYSLTRNFRNAAEKFNLTRMRELLHSLGNPQQKYPVVHVAGTKGKGSTSAMIASVLQASGFRTGLYSSPHLLEFTERIQINQKQIPRKVLADLVEEIREPVSRIPELTTFEITTALGFLFFARQKADFVVAEVGLGGRLDATNVVDPLVSVITSISYDHMNVLGSTLSQIASEKGGIIKPGKPVVIATQTDEAGGVLHKIAVERQSPITQVGEDYLFASLTHSLFNQTLLIWSREEQVLADEFIESGGRSVWEPARMIIPLLGFHQVENAATAYAAIQVLKENGVPISEEDTKTGFATVNWPARFEVIQHDPLIIVDCAHNRDSALKLRLTIDDYLADLPVILVFGASEDKDIDGMFIELLPRVREVVATESTHPRALEAGKLVELAHKHGVRASAVLPLEEALAYAIQQADGEAAVIAAGSVFVAAGIKESYARLLAHSTENSSKVTG